MAIDDMDIEDESPGNDEVTIKVPFDPTKIKVATKAYSIGQIIHDLEDGIVVLDTEFQRMPNLWDARKKSRFIESLLLRLPIPAFYFNERDESNWEVVDGLQRISTLKSFVIDKTVDLYDLEFLKEFDGFSFDNLPPTLQRRIRSFQITLYVIEKGTPDAVKYNIFKRINQGGLILRPQEIRHAINQGKPAELVADLVRGVDNVNEDGELKKRRNSDGRTIFLTATPAGIAFRKATDNSVNSARMEDRDFAARFISFYLFPYEEYEPDLDTFINKGMAKINELSSEQTAKLVQDFEKAMDLAYRIFGNDAFRKRFEAGDTRNPINKALFEVLSVNFSKLGKTAVTRLIKNKSLFRRKLTQLLRDPDGRFFRSITNGTAKKETVEQRFQDIDRILK